MLHLTVFKIYVNYRPSSRQSAGSSFDKEATGVEIIVTEPEELGTLHEVKNLFLLV